MKSRLCLSLLSILMLVGCGGGTGGSSPTPKSELVDPSGNWVMVATDEGGDQFAVAGVLDLSTPNAGGTGGTVIANNVMPIIGLLPQALINSMPASYSCGSDLYFSPGSLKFSNGSVQNSNNLAGEISFPSGLGGFTFNATLAPSASAFPYNIPESFTGTYSNMPGCVGIGMSGTLTGSQLTPMSGSWVGTAQPCNPEAPSLEGPVCSLIAGTTAWGLTFSLTQSNATGIISGTYKPLSLGEDFGGGTINSSGALGQYDYLSGLRVQFYITDSNGFSGLVSGALSSSPSSMWPFWAIISVTCVPGGCPDYLNYLLALRD
jgi:hypothetical protein